MKTRIATAAAAVIVLPALLAGTTNAAHASDVPTCDGKAATIVVSDVPAGGTTYGTDGDDVIVATPTAAGRIDGGPGNDTICASDDTEIFGGAGNDDLWDANRTNVFLPVHGGPGDDVLHGGTGRSTLLGDDGDDTLIGGDGADFLDGGDGTNLLQGGAGNDVFADELGDDTMDGGPGKDRLMLGQNDSFPPDDGNYPGAPACPAPFDAKPVLDARAGTVTGLGDDTFSGFERYDSGWYDATLLGSDGPDDLITGRCGKTVVRGRGGNDRIEVDNEGGGVVYGGAGNDYIRVDSTQVVHGGSGRDVISLDPNYDFHRESWHGSTLDGGPGRDTLLAPFVNVVDLRHEVSDGGTATLTRIENATVKTDGPGPVLIGTDGPNVLRLADLSDPLAGPGVLRGLRGNDTLLAGGLDGANGGPGHDVCRAGIMHGCEVRHVVK